MGDQNSRLCDRLRKNADAFVVGHRVYAGLEVYSAHLEKDGNAVEVVGGTHHVRGVSRIVSAEAPVEAHQFGRHTEVARGPAYEVGFIQPFDCRLLAYNRWTIIFPIRSSV